MATILRILLASLSTLGFTLSAAMYVGSFVGLAMESLGSWPFVFVTAAIFLPFIPMAILEHNPLRDVRSYWKDFAAGKPKWTVPAINVLGALALGHFLFFMVQSHLSSPDIIDGQYVLSGHGTIKKVIGETQYLHLKAAELRLFATGWSFFCFTTAMYWWFAGTQREKNPYDWN